MMQRNTVCARNLGNLAACAYFLSSAARPLPPAAPENLNET
jgi:hypothetical protein